MSKVEKKLLHYTSKAIADYGMIQKGDRIMVCLSGGKDSYTLLSVLNKLNKRPRNRYEVFAFTLDQSQPGWDDTLMRQWLDDHKIPHETLKRDTYSIVKDKIPEGKNYCSLCSRLRRGNIYRYAEKNGFTKIALGHHRDDLIESTLMSMMYSGQIRSMPPKLLTDNKRHILIRPMVYCQEKDIIEYTKERNFPIIPCNLCGSQDNLARQRVKQLIASLSQENPKIPSNLLSAIGNVQISQLMDRNLWSFKELEAARITANSSDLLLEEEQYDPFAFPSTTPPQATTIQPMRSE